MGAEAAKPRLKRWLAAALTMAVWGGGPAAAAIVDYASTVVVGPVGTAAANGTELLTALSGIAGTEADPVLLKIEPGIYDVGTTPVTMQSWVDLEGSGRGITTVRGSVAAGGSTGSGIVVVVENSELRSLTVVNETSGAGDSAAVVVHPGSRVSDVAAVATDGSATELHRAILAIAPDGVLTPPALSNVTATAAWRALQVFFPGLSAHNLEVVGEEALLLSSGSMSARDSIFRGSLLVTSLGAVSFVASQLDGALSCLFGDCRCVASYDADTRELTAGCGSCGSADWCK